MNAPRTRKRAARARNEEHTLAEVEVRVHEPASSPPSDVRDLAEWIRRHDGVESVRLKPRLGVIAVRYDERRAPGRFVEGALLDRLRALRPREPAPLRQLEVSIAHEVPGRVRLRVANAPPEAIERLAAFIDGLPGVDHARASPASASIVVVLDPQVTGAHALLDAIAEVTPNAWPKAQPSPNPAYAEWAKTGLSTAVLAASLAGVVPSPVMIGAVALTAIPSFRRALQNLSQGNVNVDVMDATAIVVCLARAEPVTASVITALLAVGDLILDRTHARARTAISRLMQLDDGEAFVLEPPNPGEPDGAPRRVHPRELAPGMHIVIYPGARVPADGIIVDGSLAVDEKALTGESVLRERVVGDRVMAASVCVHGQAVVAIERAGGDTVAARIVQILEGAGGKPMTLQRSSEKYADRLVLPTFATAGAAFALSGAVDRMASVLITDFGTGIRVSVPTAALAAMTLAAREGVLVKGASFLERLREADTIVFDKTGTLTLGMPEVIKVVVLSTRFSPGEVAAYAAGAESNQTHPIADAIRRHARAMGAPSWAAEPKSESYRIGFGLAAVVHGRRVALGNPRLMREAGIDPERAMHARNELAANGTSSVLLAVDGEVVAVIGYADAPRPESAAVVAKLKANGRRRVLLLSGDAREPVEAIARHVGIDEAIAGVLPENKADLVRRLKAEGRKVAMVGDGINDAPALAVADVGISLHGGTDVALETADVVLLEGGLERLPVVFDVADEAMARVKQVLGIVLVPNALAIAAGAFGMLSPVMAAAINNGSTILAAGHAIAPLLRTSNAERDRNGGGGRLPR